MKNKRFQAAHALLFGTLFLTIIFISGCPGTTGENIPSSPSSSTAAGLTISAASTSIADSDTGSFE
ncbi:MAG TPA: hypothetical protein QF468_05985 [Nitrospinota bacterium]|jgi:hypothetical protein|nr:hypothetical protein [Nitrospinota bacterium]